MSQGFYTILAQMNEDLPAEKQVLGSIYPECHRNDQVEGDKHGSLKVVGSSVSNNEVDE